MHSNPSSRAVPTTVRPRPWRVFALRQLFFGGAIVVGLVLAAVPSPLSPVQPVSAAAQLQVFGNSIPAGSYPWGVAVNPVTNAVYVSNNSSGSVTVVNGPTNAPVASLINLVGNDLVGVGVNPNTNKIYAGNISGDKKLHIIDGVTHGISTISGLPDGPQGIAVHLGTNRVYATAPGGNKVLIYDGITNASLGEITLPAGSYPTRIAINSATNRGYVTEQNAAKVLSSTRRPA